MKNMKYMKMKFAVAAALVSALQSVSMAQHVEKNLMPIEDRPVEAWWLESWREGWEYMVTSDFELRSKIKATPELAGTPEQPAPRPGWWSRNFGRNKVNTVIAQELGFFEILLPGTAFAESTVLEKNDDQLLLARHYRRVDTDIQIMRTAIGEKKDLIGFIMTPNRLEQAAEAVGGVFRWIARACKVVAVVVKVLPIPEAEVVAPIADTVEKTATTVSIVIENFGREMGSEYDKQINGWMKELGVEADRDGAVKVDPRGPLAQNFAGDNINDLVKLTGKLNREFGGKVFFIGADKGKMFDAREVRDSKPIGDYMQKLYEPETDAKTAKMFLDGMLAASPKVGDLVKGTLQRESYILTREIFNYEERKPGDRWIIGADVFDSLLHPDLRGSFSGTAIMVYVGDNVVENEVNKKTYSARILKLSFSEEIDGVKRTSDFKYEEKGGGFTARFDPTTVSTFFVDKEGNFLSQAAIRLKSDDTSKLPEMYLTKGLQAEGRSSVEINYYCVGTRILDLEAEAE